MNQYGNMFRYLYAFIKPTRTKIYVHGTYEAKIFRPPPKDTGKTKREIIGFLKYAGCTCCSIGIVTERTYHHAAETVRYLPQWCDTVIQLVDYEGQTR
jgi:hypothetical protein